MDFSKIDVKASVLKADHVMAFVNYHEGGHLVQYKYLNAPKAAAKVTTQLLKDEYDEVESDLYANFKTAQNGDDKFGRELGKLRDIQIARSAPAAYNIVEDEVVLTHNSGRALEASARFLDSLRLHDWLKVESELDKIFAPTKKMALKAYSEEAALRIFGDLKSGGLKRLDDDKIHQLSAAFTVTYAPNEAEINALRAFIRVDPNLPENKRMSETNEEMKKLNQPLCDGLEHDGLTLQQSEYLIAVQAKANAILYPRQSLQADRPEKISDLSTRPRPEMK